MRRRNKKTRSRNKKTPWRFAVFGHGKGWLSAETSNFAHRTTLVYAAFTPVTGA